MSEPKLCPFRTAKVYRVLVPVGSPPMSQEIPQDEFFPCLQDECAMWHPAVPMVIHQNAIVGGKLVSCDTPINQTGYCGLAGKP